MDWIYTTLRGVFLFLSIAQAMAYHQTKGLDIIRPKRVYLVWTSISSPKVYISPGSNVRQSKESHEPQTCVGDVRRLCDSDVRTHVSNVGLEYESSHKRKTTPLRDVPKRTVLHEYGISQKRYAVFCICGHKCSACQEN